MKCLICDNEFSSRQKFAHHLNSVHNTNTKEYKLQYKPDKDNNLLECPICGKYNMKQLTQHLTDIHNITKEDFIAQYPNTKLWIDEISERCSKAQSKGIKTFKSNLEKDPNYYAESFANRAKNRDNVAIAEKVRQTRIERGTNEKMSERVKLLWQDENYRNFQIEKTKRQHENGLTEIITKKSGKKRFKITLNNVTYYMRSTWEIAFATYLNEHNIEFKYEPFAIKYEFNEKVKTYYPDFYIINSHLVVEIKPYNLCNDLKVQAKKLATEAQGYKFMFITENELNSLNTIQFE